LANDSDQKAYKKNEIPLGGLPKGLGLGLVSAASALAGGLAMAWWYRKTLSKFQNPIVKDGGGDSESHKVESEPPQ
jgi:hypothetical protein